MAAADRCRRWRARHAVSAVVWCLLLRGTSGGAWAADLPEPAAAQEYRYAELVLQPGWNLVSVESGLYPADTVAGVLADAAAGTVWEWDAAAQAHVPAARLRPGRGYWVRCEVRGPVTVPLLYVLPGAAPVVQEDRADVVGTAPVQVDVLGNDTGAEAGAALRLVLVAQPQHGAAAIRERAVVYTPGADFAGTDTFLYAVTDAQGRASVGRVRIGGAGARVAGPAR